MKRLLTALMAILLLLPTACQDGMIDEIIEKKQDSISNIQSFTPSDDVAFMAHVSTLFGRVKGKAKMPDIDWKRGKKIKNSKTGEINYTVGLQHTPLQYLIVHEGKGKVEDAYYLTFNPKGQLAYDAKGYLDWTKFTGTMERIGLDGEVLETKEFGLGKANGKVTACGEYLVPIIDAGGGDATTEPEGNATGTQQYALVTICYGGDGNSGTDSGSSYWWDYGDVLGGGSGSTTGSTTASNMYGEPITMLDENTTMLDEAAAYFWEATHITLDSSFKNNPCAMEVWKELQASNLLYSTLGKFHDRNDINLTWKIGDLSVYNAAGKTEVDMSGNVTIILDKNLFGMTSKLGIVSVMIHESIHAELGRAVAEQNYTVDVFDLSIVELMEEFSKLNPSELSDIGVFNPVTEHLLMAKNFRGVIATGLYTFLKADPSSPDAPHRTIEILSWGGLLPTVRVAHLSGDFNIIGDEQSDWISWEDYDFFSLEITNSTEDPNRIVKYGKKGKPCNK